MDLTQTSITLPLPPEWVFRESLTLVAPSGRANVIASSEPVPSDMDTSAYALTQRELLKELPGYEELSTETFTLAGGEQALLRKHTWQPEDTKPVTQLQVYYVSGDRAYTVTATAPTEEFDEHRAVLGEVVAGLGTARSPQLAP